MIDIKELRAAVKTIGVMAVSTQEVSELLDRLEAAESACRDDYQNWMTALDRNADLLTKLEAAEKERDELRAKIEQMEKQEPVAWMSSRNGFIVKDNKNHDYNMPLYLAPGAQPAPSVPEFCPCCGNIMRACMSCPNEDCNAVTVTAEQAKYNKQHALARNASIAATPEAKS